ncbi:MAG: DUF2851 family protein [Mucilaginibacter polytrichastri]|nr:DUF2851 family protein [Mucilaginibacter polytrichastri]
MFFQEDLLHFIWKYRLYDPEQLCCADGQPLRIVYAGQHNTDAGPDFLHAQIRIGETLWAGNVEIHMRASDWIRHGHDHDRAYDNVILHVVYEHDGEICRTDGSGIAVFTLKNRVSDAFLLRYHQLLDAQQRFIPCENAISQVDEFHRRNWLERVAIERLTCRSEKVLDTVQRNKGDWEESTYQLLARNFGFHVNADPFEWLAASLPLKILGRHNTQQIEALLFGQAGMLTADLADQYPAVLRKEYLFLQKKQKLDALPLHIWKFARMRPLNFPTLRIAQFSGFIARQPAVFQHMLSLKDPDQLAALFSGVKTAAYWNEHFRFDKTSLFQEKNIGIESANQLLINTIAPVLFAYGRYTQKPQIVQQSIQLLEILPPENNKFIAGFVNLQVKPASAQDSQALLQLKQAYCDKRKCLDCGIGNRILNNYRK